MREAIGEAGIEDNPPPVHRHRTPVDDRMTCGRLHPAVGRQNPEGRRQGAKRHHAGCQKVELVADPVPTEQHDAEKARLHRECGNHLISDKRPQHVADIIGIA